MTPWIDPASSWGRPAGQAPGWLDNLPVLSNSTTPAIIVTFFILSISVIVVITKVTFSVFIKRVIVTISVVMVIVILITIVIL